MILWDVCLVLIVGIGLLFLTNGKEQLKGFNGRILRLAHTHLMAAAPENADVSSTVGGELQPEEELDAQGHVGFLVHQPGPSASTEGLGSRARSLIYPLLQAALGADLIPVFDNHTLDGSSSHDYQGLDIAGLLGLNAQYTVPQLLAHHNVLELNTWTDEMYGSCCGDAGAVEQMVKEAVGEYQGPEPIVVVLRGAIRFAHPTAAVCRWLQGRCGGCSAEQLCVAVHLRVREDWIQDYEHRVNGVSVFVEALKRLEVLQPEITQAQLLVYTVKSFSEADEQELKSRFGNARVLRGNKDTMLSDLAGLASADVFVASASWFSAMAGYMAAGESVIVLANEENVYFEDHKQHNGNAYTLNHPGLPAALQNAVERKLGAHPLL